MLDKLQAIEDKYLQLESMISDPDIIADMNKWQKYTREHSKLGEIVVKFREYKEVLQGLDDAKEMQKEETDDEFKKMIDLEVAELKTKLSVLETELPILLLPKDPNDDKSVIVEIRGGAGGDEAALFAGNLFRMYTRYAEVQGWKTEILDSNPTELGGFKEVVFEIDGYGAYSKLKYESGVHRVQRVPTTESSGRIHTSTVTVAVLPEVEEVDVVINQNDLRIDTYCASGAGGQHVNRTESAVRITHLPTGIVVQCQNERSQHHNKEKAMQMLKAKLQLMKEQEQAEKVSDIRGEVKDIGFGNQIRSYVMQPYTLVKDHRTNEENSNVNAVMDGDIDSFINAYLKKIANG